MDLVMQVISTDKSTRNDTIQRLKDLTINLFNLT